MSNIKERIMARAKQTMGGITPTFITQRTFTTQFSEALGKKKKRC